MTKDDGPRKRASGLKGLDAATRGGLPASGLTLVMGRAGSGKTVLGLQLLSEAVARGEAGVLISFEESPEQLRRNAMAFSWGPTLAESAHLSLIDGRCQRDSDTSGGFDLAGLIAVLDAEVDRVGAGWVVLDGIDQLLRLEPDPYQAIGEVERLADWSRGRGLTALMTAKEAAHDGTTAAHLEGVEFILSTILALSTDLVGHRLNRRFRVVKYRGSPHVTDELPAVINDRGLHLPTALALSALDSPTASEARLSTGIPRLDELLDGGYYRGSGILISGAPGTSKTTLAGTFLDAACARGEKALMVSFDEPGQQIVRNLRSVGIDLRAPVADGRLRQVWRIAWSALVEEHYLAILDLIEAEKPDCLVIDPVSALSKAESRELAYPMIERLLIETRKRQITTLMTSLTDRSQDQLEASKSDVSTIADTWIALDYQVRGGERNRALSIVKSRGAAHSAQMRELLLSRDGVDLADVYQYGSEVLMGTARLQKESEAAQEQRAADLARQRREAELQSRLAGIEARIAEAESEKHYLETEIALASEGREADLAAAAAHTRRVRRSRGRASGDPTGAGPTGDDET